MNTNDPQAKYGKPTERAPMLSDEELNRPDEAYTAEDVRAWYEAKITSGELRVVKAGDYPCSQCGEYPTY